jgi:hypothetical protein
MITREMSESIEYSLDASDSKTVEGRDGKFV